MNGESSSEDPTESGTIAIEDQKQAFKVLSVRVGTGKKLRVGTRHFDGLGKWEPEPAMIQISEISFVRFETPYINAFCKYLNDFNPTNPD